MGLLEGFHLMKVAEMRRFYRLLPAEFWLGMTTLVGVIVLNVLPGLIIGVGFCILLVIYRASRVPLSVLGSDPSVPGAYVDAHRHPEAHLILGVLLVHPDGPVFYANAQSVQDIIESLVSDSQGQVRRVIIDLDANDDLDITASEKLGKLVRDLRKRHIEIGFAHLHDPALDMARRAGVLDDIDTLHTFETMADAVKWAKTDTTGTSPKQDI